MTGFCCMALRVCTSFLYSKSWLVQKMRHSHTKKKKEKYRSNGEKLHELSSSPADAWPLTPALLDLLCLYVLLLTPDLPIWFLLFVLCQMKIYADPHTGSCLSYLVLQSPITLTTAFLLLSHIWLDTLFKFDWLDWLDLLPGLNSTTAHCPDSRDNRSIQRGQKQIEK